MGRPTRSEIEAKITALKKQKQQLENQLSLLQNREAIARRKLDARRKILIGAERLARLQKGELTEEQLRAELSGYLTRKQDRELFGLDG